jgi:hypothetical protein
MWDHAGAFRGVLLQGLAPGSSNPCWSLDIDVARRESVDRESTRTVMDTLEEFERVEEENRSRRMSSVKYKRRESQLSYRLEKAKEMAIAMQDAHHGGSGLSTAGSTSTSATPLSPPSDMRMHSRVRSALSDVKSMHTAEPPPSDGLLSETSSWQSHASGMPGPGGGRRRSSTVGRRSSRGGKSGGGGSELALLSLGTPKPSVMGSQSATDLFQNSALTVQTGNSTPGSSSAKRHGSLGRKSGSGASLGKQILDHKKRAPKSHFLSVVPPLPDLKRLGPEAQASLDNLALALSM